MVGERGYLVGATAHLDLVLRGDGLCRSAGPLDANGERGVQVDDLERVAHESLELGDRGVVVDGLDGEQLRVDVRVRETVQFTEQQLGLPTGRQGVRVREALPVGRLPQQEADLEALRTAGALDELGAGALAALAQSTEGEDPAQTPTRLDLCGGGAVPAVQLEASRYGEPHGRPATTPETSASRAAHSSSRCP